MNNNPCIDIPSPTQIHNSLFTNPIPKPPAFPGEWRATALLSPFGGLNPTFPLMSSDELVVAKIYYNSTSAPTPYLRVRMYLLESLMYYDFFFSSQDGQPVWYWLVSDPSDPSPEPVTSEEYGPFSTSVQVPAPTFLADKGFSYVGTWNVVNQSCDGYATGTGTGNAGTWFSALAQTNTLSRIMNVDNTNDFNIPVLGAYYLVNFPTFQAATLAGDPVVQRKEMKPARISAGPSPMVTLQDIQTAMANPPTGATQVACTAADIANVIPGISFPKVQPEPPAWTNQVQSSCYMMGQDTYPYFCQVYYDYTVNKAQVSVFVTQDTTGTYDARQDELLPRGVVGPAVNYNWNPASSQWEAACYAPGGSVVPMSVPNFVEAGGGRCRAVIANNPYFGPNSVTIWSVALGGQSGWSDFWYWFDWQQKGIVFSLAPAGSLTMIDYQTFVQNPALPPCTFDEPIGNLPQCSSAFAERRKKVMLIPKGGF